jgi:hypothetical protein
VLIFSKNFSGNLVAVSDKVKETNTVKKATSMIRDLKKKKKVVKSYKRPAYKLGLVKYRVYLYNSNT